MLTMKYLSEHFFMFSALSHLSTGIYIFPLFSFNVECVELIGPWEDCKKMSLQITFTNCILINNWNTARPPPDEKNIIRFFQKKSLWLIELAPTWKVCTGNISGITMLKRERERMNCQWTWYGSEHLILKYIVYKFNYKHSVA